jgi:peptidoglycan hydrolase CwlO-like protein
LTRCEEHKDFLVLYEEGTNCPVCNLLMEIEDLEDSITGLENDLSNNAYDFEEAQNHIKNLEEEIDDLKNEIKEKNTEISNLDYDIEELEKRLA